MVVCLLKQKIDKIERKTDNRVSLAKEEEVNNCFICTYLSQQIDPIICLSVVVGINR